MSSDDIKPIEEVKEQVEQIEPTEQNNDVSEAKEEPINKVEDKKEETTESKTARLAEKKITCPKCNKIMCLRSYRYKHEKNCQGNLEDRPIKPQSKPKSKITAVALKPIQNEVIEETEPIYLKEVKQKVIREPAQPVKMKTPQEIISDNYKILHQEYMDKRKEKADNLFKSMFVGNTRRKKR